MPKSTQKRFWKYALLVSLALLLAGTPAAYFGGKYYLRQRTLHWRQQGIEASRAGDHERASELLALYLKRIPDDPDALIAYIKSREAAELPNGAHLAETIRALKMLLGLDPGRLEERRHLLDLYVRVQRRPEALDTANAILAQVPADARTLGLKWQILTGLAQHREALEIAEQWAAASPADIHAQMAKVSGRFKAGQPKPAIIADVNLLLAQSGASAESGDAEFQFLLGYTYAQAGDDAQAMQLLKAAAKHPKLSADVVRLMVTQFDRLGSSADSVALLQDLATRGAAPEVRHLLATHLWEQGKWGPAAELLADISLADAKADPTLIALRAISLDNLGKSGEAAAAECRTALAGRRQAAAEAWTLILQRSTNTPTDDRDLVAACRQALVLDSQNPYLLYYLGDAFARLGEQEMAISAWNSIVQQEPSWPLPGTRLVEALLQKGRSDQALSTAAVLARRHSTNAATLIMLARAWSAALEAGEAAKSDDLLKLVDELLSQLPGEEQCSLIRVRLLAQKGDKSGAIQTAKALLARTPPPAEQTFTKLVALSRAFELGLQEECLNHADQAYPASPDLAYARAVDRYFADSKHTAGDSTAERFATLQQFDESAARTGKAQDKSWKLARARLLDVTGSKDAKAAYLELGQSFPRDLPVQLAIASSRTVSNDWDIMLPTIDRLKVLEGTGGGGSGIEQGLTWRMIQGRLYIQAARSDADIAQGALLMNKLVTEYPELPEARMLLASALIQMNRFDGAAEQLAIAARLEPESLAIAIQFANSLIARGDSISARQQMDRILPLIHTSADRRQIAAVLARAGDGGAALKLVEQDPRITASGGATQADDLFLAVLYRQQRQFDKAEALIRGRLNKPDVATVQFAVDFYLSQGRRSDAEEALARLEGLKLEPGVLEFARGDFYQRVGEFASAATQFSAALQKSPTSPTAWRMLATTQLALGQADEVLATLDKAAAALPADKGFATFRQNRELFKCAAEDPTLRSEVAQILAQPQPGEIQIEFLRLIVDAQGSVDMERLSTRLQQFIERHPDYLPAYLRLAGCYAAMSRPNDALAAAKRTITAFPTRTEPAQLAAELCARFGQWDEMRAAAEIWKKRSPGGENVDADVAIARALNGLGQYDAAQNQLRPYLTAGAGSKYGLNLVAAYVVALANSNPAKAIQAADLLWPSTRDSAGRSLWMRVALELRDSKLGASWLDRITRVIPPDAILERVQLVEALDALARRTSDPALSQKASDIARELAQDPKPSLAALLVAANQAAQSGDNATAETYYRRALAIDPANAFANNNLAMILLQRGGEGGE